MTITYELASLDSARLNAEVPTHLIDDAIAAAGIEAVAILLKRNDVIISVEVVFESWADAACDLCGIIDSDDETGFDSAFGLDAYRLKTGAISVLCQPCAASSDVTE